MPPEERETRRVEGEPDKDASLPSDSSSVRLLRKARAGDREALENLFARVGPSLRRWARGRLPRWARARADTGDVVQDALIHALGRLHYFEPRQRKALRAYLRQAVLNRIRDEIRWAGHHRVVDIDDVDLTAPVSLFDHVNDRENLARYRRALATLSSEDQELVVARLELGYSYEQVALVTGRPSPDAARVAIRRAIVRLAGEIASG
jgi:RNA polymerase sigma factor (sigma-70 family)